MTNEQQIADQFEAFLCGEVSLAGEDARFARQLMELSQQIHPSESFVAELESQFTVEPQGVNHRHNHTYLRRGLGAVAALALVLFGFLLTPAGRSVAQAAWNFFTRSETDEGIITVFMSPENSDSAAAAPTPQSPVEELAAERPVVRAQDGATIPTSFEPTNTSERPDYAVFLPKAIPQGYHVDRVEFHPLGPMTVIEYMCGRNTAFFLTQLAISVQSYLADAVYQREVGASAEIVDVDVMGVSAQYVHGDWVPAEPVNQDDIAEGSTLDVETVWDNDADYHHLSWYTDGMLFRIYTSRVAATEAPECDLTMTDFVAFANSLTPVE